MGCATHWTPGSSADELHATRTAIGTTPAHPRPQRRRSRWRHARMTELDLLLRSLAALVAGAVVGLERTYRGRAAGLRTYALVAFGASLLVGSAEFAPGWAAMPG